MVIIVNKLIHNKLNFNSLNLLVKTNKDLLVK